MHVGFLVRSVVALTELWTTVHWISATLGLGHTVWVLESRDLAVSEKRWTARAFRLRGEMEPAEVVRGLTRRTVPRQKIRLGNLDVVLLRCAPLELSMLALGEALAVSGVRVVNKPAGQAVVAHKSWLAAQELPIPHTIVTSSRGEAHVFHERWGEVVVKPDRGSGGQAVHLVKGGDYEGMEEAFAAARGQRGRVVLQERIDGSEGEKRLIWCDGEVLGGYLRHSAEGEFRHNLKCGGRPERLVLNDFDRSLGPMLQPLLRPLGVRFAGLDVLGEMLLEVNAVNPGGTVYADALNGTRLGEAVIRRILEAPVVRNKR